MGSCVPATLARLGERIQKRASRWREREGERTHVDLSQFMVISTVFLFFFFGESREKEIVSVRYIAVVVTGGSSTVGEVCV